MCRAAHCDSPSNAPRPCPEIRRYTAVRSAPNLTHVALPRPPRPPRPRPRRPPPAGHLLPLLIRQLKKTARVALEVTHVRQLFPHRLAEPARRLDRHDLL